MHMKPTVKCLMMATIDGKIGSKDATTDVVDDFLDIYRDIDNGIAGNAWMCGRVTTKLYFAKKEPAPLPIPTNAITPGDFVGYPNATRYYVTVDTKGSLRFNDNFISFYPEHGNLHIIVIVTQSTPKEYLHYLQDKKISYLISEGSEVDFHGAMTKLNSLFHIRTLLLEGGARINGSMLKAGLIDQLYLLVIPRVLSDPQAPSVFEDPHHNPADVTSFTLQKSEIKPRGCILLHYTK